MTLAKSPYRASVWFISGIIYYSRETNSLSTGYLFGRQLWFTSCDHKLTKKCRISEQSCATGTLRNSIVTLRINRFIEQWIPLVQLLIWGVLDFQPQARITALSGYHIRRPQLYCLHRRHTITRVLVSADQDETILLVLQVGQLPVTIPQNSNTRGIILLPLHQAALLLVQCMML
jgi:hypothetical protein